MPDFVIKQKKKKDYEQFTCRIEADVLEKVKRTVLDYNLPSVNEFINSVEYRNKLKQIKRSSSLKFKIMCNVLLINNNYIIYILGKIANTYDKFQKKKKYF